MKTEIDLFLEWLKNTNNTLYDFSEDFIEDDSKESLCFQWAWTAWMASANREGYKLVPVDSLKIVLNCIDQDNLFFINGAFKALDDIEKAMIGAADE